MERNIQKNGMVNGLLLLAAASGTALMAHLVHSATGLAGAAILGLGCVVAAVSYFQMRLHAREAVEQLEYDELRKSATSAALFAEQAVDTFPARRAREQFERFFVPVVAVLLLGLQLGAAWWIWSMLRDARPATPFQATLAMAVYGGVALVLFLFGKYSAGLSRIEGQRLLRPGASYLLLGSLVALITAGVEVASWLGYPHIDVLVARGLVGVLLLVAVETLCTLVFELYRPRVKGQLVHLLYESRLIGLLGQPGGLIKTLAQALDYQFGFKVSETWFYQFLQKAFGWLVLGQLALLLVSTMFVVVEPGEQALLERFGRPVERRGVLNPGLHLKLPWPVEQVYPFKTHAVQSFNIGFVAEEHEETERVLLWSKGHFKEEFNFLVASRESQDVGGQASAGEQAVPVNLLAVNIPVQYQVTNLVAFAYNHANAGALLENLATGEVTRYLVNVDIDDVMSGGRLRAAETLRERIQARADAERLGVAILFVGLQGIHPPVKVAPAYESTIGAIQEREAHILQAEGYAAEQVPLARAEAARRVAHAQAYALRKTAAATALVTRFTNQLAAYRIAPAVFQQRAYLDAWSRAATNSRKYVLGVTNTLDTLTLNLEDKIRPDLGDAMIPADAVQSGAAPAR